MSNVDIDQIEFINLLAARIGELEKDLIAMRMAATALTEENIQLRFRIDKLIENDGQQPTE